MTSVLFVLALVVILTLRVNVSHWRARVQGYSAPRGAKVASGAFDPDAVDERARALTAQWQRDWRRIRPLTWELPEDRTIFVEPDPHTASAAELAALRQRVRDTLAVLGDGPATLVIPDWAESLYGAGTRGAVRAPLWPWRVLGPKPSDDQDEVIYLWAAGPELASRLVDVAIDARVRNEHVFALIIPQRGDWLLGICDGVVVTPPRSDPEPASRALRGDAG